MESPMLIVIIGAGIILSAVVVIFAATRKPLLNEEASSRDKYPQYFFMSIGMTLGIASGILLGLAAGSVSGGIAIGIGLGLIFGQFLEKKRKGDVDSLTEQEKQERRNRAGVGLVAVFILVLGTLLAAILTLLK